MYDEIPLGPTGEFPDGKTRDDDAGETRIAVGPDGRGNVVIDFGAPTTWVAFDPARARALAMTLLKHARSIDGVPVSLVIGGPS